MRLSFLPELVRNILLVSAFASSHVRVSHLVSLDCEFPSTFRRIVAKIMQRLFRVYAHIYHQHFRDILALNAPAHLNSAFKRFVLFCQEFKLLQPRDTAPLQDLIDKKLNLNGMKKVRSRRSLLLKNTPVGRPHVCLLFIAFVARAEDRRQACSCPPAVHAFSQVTDRDSNQK